MRYILPFVLLFILPACKSDLQFAEDAIRKDIKNEAFKNNYKATIHELKVIEVKPESESYILNRQLTFLDSKVSSLIDIHGLTVELADNTNRQRKLYASMDMPDLAEMKREDAIKQIDEAKKYESNIKAYQAMFDSLSKKKIDTTAKNYYLIKCFLKATIDNDNTLDTLYYIADKKWAIINPMNGLILNDD